MSSIKAVDWQQRSSFWLEKTPSPVTPKRRERSTDTLILCGHGISLRVENGSLAIKNGFTHYPQEQETFRYFRGDLTRPVRIIVLDGSGHLTFDVLDWLADQDVPLLRISWTGDVVTVAGGSGYSADREKVAWQRATRDDECARVAFATALIREKVENCQQALQAVIPASEARDAAIDTLARVSATLTGNVVTTVAKLRGMEGVAAAAYFGAWQGVPLQWKTCKRRPFPDTWLTLGSRSSQRQSKLAKNRHATHPINAMLNYGYAVAIGQVKLTALADGYDPTFGIMHHEYRDGPAFALDLVEPIRPLVDRAIISFALANELHPADFAIKPNGCCRLNPQLARSVLQAVGQSAALN
ncbi:CRISPR-associated endonuclease Cas1 [Methylobacterium durans]|nr:CRISPR-associated endonuclease Cas1 [Methylobacterium durans]